MPESVTFFAYKVMYKLITHSFSSLGTHIFDCMWIQSLGYRHLETFASVSFGGRVRDRQIDR